MKKKVRYDSINIFAHLRDRMLRPGEKHPFRSQALTPLYQAMEQRPRKHVTSTIIKQRQLNG